MRPTIDQAVDVALSELPIELRPLVGMDLPAYTLGCEVDGAATSSKGGVAVRSGEGVLSGFECWGTGYYGPEALVTTAQRGWNRGAFPI